jgi:hypothetical protein
MPFRTVPDLTQRIIRKLRQVPGLGTQLYSEDYIAELIEEVYGMVRTDRWWDHLMSWHTRVLDGITGQVTVALPVLREGFRDIRQVRYGRDAFPLPQLGAGVSPQQMVTAGTRPRFVEPLPVTHPNYATRVFRVHPLNAVTPTGSELHIHLRSDPANLFVDDTVAVPFDDICLINGVVVRYAASDSANVAEVEVAQRTFMDRLDQLRRMHDNAALALDPRSPLGTDQWHERW